MSCWKLRVANTASARRLRGERSPANSRIREPGGLPSPSRSPSIGINTRNKTISNEEGNSWLAAARLEWFDALSTRTGELNDRSHRSLPGRPRPHIQHGLLLEDPHSAISKTNGRGDENHSGITRNWRQYAEAARGLRGYRARPLRLR